MTDYFEKAKQILPQGFAMKKDVEWLASRLKKADKFEALAIPVHLGTEPVPPYPIPTLVEGEEDRILNIIAVEVSKSNHGDFLRCFAEAWQRTDPSNKRILLEPWKRLVTKYRFREEYADVIKRELREVP